MTRCDYIPSELDWECDPDVDPRHPDNHVCADCADGIDPSVDGDPWYADTDPIPGPGTPEGT